MLDNRKAYEGMLEAELARWTAELDALKAKARPLDAEAKLRADQALDALQHRHDEAENHLLKLKVASDDTWESLKAGIEQSWLEIKTMFHSSPEKT